MELFGKRSAVRFILALMVPIFVNGIAEANEVYSILGQKFSTSETQSGRYVEGGYLHSLNRNLSVGVGVGYAVFDNKVNTLSQGDIKMVPLLLKFRVQAPGMINPFFEIGGGYFILDHTTTYNVTTACAARGYRCAEAIENAFGGKVGAGLTVKLTFPPKTRPV